MVDFIDTNQTTIEGELMPCKSDGRMTPKAVDELYIECFLDNPSNKSAALRKAMDLSGQNGSISRSMANQVHRRLKRQIDQGLLKRMSEGGTLGYSVTYSLAADESIHPGIRLKAAENLMLYAGKSKPELIRERRERKDIRAEIEATRQRIKDITKAEDI